MMQRFRDRVYFYFDDLCCRISFFFHRLHGSKRVAEPENDIIRGTAHNIIVVTPPEPEVFREVMFILRDDYMRSSLTKEALLQQAADAAGEYASRYCSSAGRRQRVPVLLLPILTAALGFVLGKLI